MQGFVALVISVVILAFLRLLWRERANLAEAVRRWRGQPARVVSRVSPTPTAVFAANAPTVIMSRRPDRELAVRYQAVVQLRFARIEAENAKLKAEIERLKSENAKLKQFTEGQRAAVREYLIRDRAGKLITRTTVTKLLGRDTTKGFVLIGEEMERLDREAPTAASGMLEPQAA